MGRTSGVYSQFQINYRSMFNPAVLLCEYVCDFLNAQMPLSVFSYNEDDLINPNAAEYCKKLFQGMFDLSIIKKPQSPELSGEFGEGFLIKKIYTVYGKGPAIKRSNLFCVAIIQVENEYEIETIVLTAGLAYDENIYYSRRFCNFYWNFNNFQPIIRLQECFHNTYQSNGFPFMAGFDRTLVPISNYLAVINNPDNKLKDLIVDTINLS